MLERQAAELRKEPTLYDRRMALIQELEYLEMRKEDGHQQARHFTLKITEAKQQLKAINQDISDELLMDSVR